MLKKQYFLFLLPLAFIPVIYYSGVDNWINMWNLMSEKMKENILKQKIQKIQPDSKFLIKSEVKKNVSTPDYSGVNLNNISKKMKKNILKQKIQKIQPDSKLNKSQVKKNVSSPVPYQNRKLTLGPTAANYNETPYSDQVGKNLKNDITVVSVYFWLPPFPKGGRNIIRSPSSYQKWMKAFRWIINPMVIYTDDEKSYTRLTTLFQQNNKTSVKVIKIHRETLWSFQQLPNITRIFQQKEYPVHYPNTVIPAYNCMTHAKFEALKIAIEKNWFQTKYFMWLDIGYFRFPIAQEFGLSLPKNFDDRRIGVTRVGHLQDGEGLETAVRGNKNWIAGGCLLGRFDILRTFCIEYLDFVKKAIKQKMVGVEQQLIYAMFSGPKKPKTSIQYCYPGWFCMGRLAADTWWHKNN